MASTRPLISNSSSDNTKRTNYNWYHHHFHLPQFSLFSCKVPVFISPFAFLQFYPLVSWNDKVHHSAASVYILLIIIVIIIIYSLQFFTGDWVTASPLKSPGLFSVFWPSSIMLLFGLSPLGRQLLNPPGPLIIP